MFSLSAVLLAAFLLLVAVILRVRATNTAWFLVRARDATHPHTLSNHANHARAGIRVPALQVRRGRQDPRSAEALVEWYHHSSASGSRQPRPAPQELADLRRHRSVRAVVVLLLHALTNHAATDIATFAGIACGPVRSFRSSSSIIRSRARRCSRARIPKVPAPSLYRYLDRHLSLSMANASPYTSDLV